MASCFSSGHRPLTPLSLFSPCYGAIDKARADEAMAQGATRLARGRNYFVTGRVRAKAADENFGWRLAIVPGSGHEVTQVAGSAGFFLFQSDKSPCRSTAAAKAGGLGITEILADPPDGDRGDANADGVRDPLGE